MFRKIALGIMVSFLLVQSLMAQEIQFSKERMMNMETRQSEGSTMVPVTQVAEMMNLRVICSKLDRTIQLMDMGNVFTLRIGEYKAGWNQKEIQLTAAPIDIEGTLYVPLRSIAEAFGYKLVVYEDVLVLERSLSEEDIQIIKSWENQYDQYGFIYALYSEEQEDMPYEAAKESMSGQIKRIKADIESDKTSTLVKVLGQECVSILEYAETIYDLSPTQKTALERAYYTFKNKWDYIHNEYRQIQSGMYEKLESKRGVTYNFPYDELRISGGYEHIVKRLDESVEDIQKRFLNRNIHLDEMIYRISEMNTIREDLKVLKILTRSEEAQKVLDTYITYADCVITYYCEMRNVIYSPQSVDQQDQKRVENARSNVEKAYQEYQSFYEINQIG